MSAVHVIRPGRPEDREVLAEVERMRRAGRVPLEMHGRRVSR